MDITSFDARGPFADRPAVPAISVERQECLSAAVMAVRSLPDTEPVDQLERLSATLGCRMMALSNHFADQGCSRGKAFAVLDGKDMKVLRAAARAPLDAVEGSFADCRFNLVIFLEIVQEQKATRSGSRWTVGR